MKIEKMNIIVISIIPLCLHWETKAFNLNSYPGQIAMVRGFNNHNDSDLLISIN